MSKFFQKIEDAAKEIKADILGLDLSPILSQIPDGATIKQIEDVLEQIWLNPEFNILMKKMMAYLLVKFKI